MRSVVWFGALALAAAFLLSFGSSQVCAQGSFEQVIGKELDSGLVRDFYLEGNAIPMQKRNAVMLKCKAGKRLVFGLLDTSGYGTDVQQKYTGMAVVEKKVAVGGAELGVGAYGFGIEKAAVAAEGPARVLFYDVAGQKVGEATAQYDKELKQPMPLQVVLAKDQPARLCLGRHWLEIK
jgi:hypothetical protein